jgi:hypothetical protein
MPQTYFLLDILLDVARSGFGPVGFHGLLKICGDAIDVSRIDFSVTTYKTPI